MSNEKLIEDLRGYKSTPRHCEELCYEAAIEIESLRQQLEEFKHGQDAYQQMFNDSQKREAMLRDTIDKAATQIKRCDYTPARSVLLQALAATEPKP